MVKGEEDSVWLRLYSRFQALAEEARSSQKTTNFGVTYVETIPVLDFEKKNSTVIEFAMSKPYSWEEISENNPEQKQSTQFWNIYMLISSWMARRYLQLCIKEFET